MFGQCRRNLTAGRSGGSAYELDETSYFAEKRCNTPVVDLESVSEEDIRILQEMIEEHVETTGSPRGQWILESWDSMLEKFIKIFPHEYKRVLGVPRLVERMRAAV